MASTTSKFPFIESTPKGLYIRVRLTPRASKDQIEGVQANSLKIKLTAPPVEGEANKALIEFLSKLIGVRKSDLSIDAGLKSRGKRVKVEGVTLEGLEGVFEKAMDEFFEK